MPTERPSCRRASPSSASSTTSTFVSASRASSAAPKAGNVAEWGRRFGGRYETMIVLDADSLMTGDTIVRLVGAMERHPRVGITLLARLQQFSGRVYGPILAHGLAWWHGADGNYWGHNAIIRVAPFVAHCELPVLPGREPFGGEIRCHDGVEAGLKRGAGGDGGGLPQVQDSDWGRDGRRVG